MVEVAATDDLRIVNDGKDTEQKFALNHPGGTLPLEVTQATEGASGLGIAKLLSTTGHVTLDSGFTNTASCSSSITYIDGDEGILRYRGYPIEQLAEKSTFGEVSYLLLHGHLPTAEQLEEHRVRVHRRTMVPEEIKGLFNALPRDAHPMAVLSSATAALSTFYPQVLDPLDEDQVEEASDLVLAKVPTLAAYAYRRMRGHPYIYPDNSIGFAENFLKMCFSLPAEEWVPDERFVKALDLLFILHADHEQNCSTSSVRLVGSSQANLFVSVASGINALYGPLHGGANQAVLEMLTTIRDRGLSVDGFVDKVKNREDGLKLMGFGHRVYKNYDPRAAIVKNTAHEILGGVDNPLLEIAKKLEERALSDEYFIERKLYPNVDFYTGLIYEAMGFPQQMYTVLFAIGRLPGWIAQWREMMADPETKIGRPRQVYVGETKRDYVPFDQR